MKRILLVATALLFVGVTAAYAITKTYSTGNIDVPVVTSLDRSLNVPDRGPVSFVRVSFRISAPDTSALALSLVSPKGTVVPLVTNRGSGADFGTGKGCTGELTVIESDMESNPISARAAPFTDDPYRAEGKLASLYGQDARGTWTLRIADSGAPARLECLTLDISRAVPQTLAARHGSVAATVSFTERNYTYEHLGLKIVRAGHTVLQTTLRAAGCRDCEGSQPTGVQVRDLDGGEPEVIVDLYTGGAHCCSEWLVLRWDGHRYRSNLEYWGNYGANLVDLDHDGLPEVVASDERFLYTFTAYVFSAAPPQIFDYREGKLVDVTKRFPAQIEKNAVETGKEFLRLTKPLKDVDLRAYVATYVADEYLLGRPDVAQQTLAAALKDGLLYRGTSFRGSPAGARFVAVLMHDLRTWGYLR